MLRAFCEDVSRFRVKLHPTVLGVANYNINPTGLARRDYTRRD